MCISVRGAKRTLRDSEDLVPRGASRFLCVSSVEASLWYGVIYPRPIFLLSPSSSLPPSPLPLRLVTFEGPEGVSRAMELLSGREVEGRPLYIREDRTDIEKEEGFVIFVSDYAREEGGREEKGKGRGWVLFVSPALPCTGPCCLFPSDFTHPLSPPLSLPPSFTRSATCPGR